MMVLISCEKTPKTKITQANGGSVANYLKKCPTATAGNFAPKLEVMFANSFAFTH